MLTRESTSTESDSQSAECASPSHDVPGESFIDPSETAGLPGAGTERHSVQQAQQVINAHRRGLFGNMHMHVPGFSKHTESKDASGGSGVRQRKKQRRKAKWRLPLSGTTTDTDSDVEKNGESPVTPIMAARGAGVLSALLALYDSNDAASGTIGTPSIRSSFDESRPSSFFMPARTMTQDSTASAPERGQRSRSRSRERQPRWAGSANGSAVSLAALPNIRLPKPWGDSRPAQARNGAGVFGPLIASTGNIAGAAAPNNATLAPNIKRPGYHLSRYASMAHVHFVAYADLPSRYSLESNLPQAKEKTQPKLGRPRSMHFDTTNSGDSIPDNPSHLRTSSYPPDEDDSPTSLKSRTKWAGVLKDLPKRGWSRAGTPSTPGTPVTSDEEWLEKEKEKLKSKEKADRVRREKRRRKKAEVYVSIFWGMTLDASLLTFV